MITDIGINQEMLEGQLDSLIEHQSVHFTLENETLTLFKVEFISDISFVINSEHRVSKIVLDDVTSEYPLNFNKCDVTDITVKKLSVNADILFSGHFNLYIEKLSNCRILMLSGVKCKQVSIYSASLLALKIEQSEILTLCLGINGEIVTGTFSLRDSQVQNIIFHNIHTNISPYKEEWESEGLGIHKSFIVFDSIKHCKSLSIEDIDTKSLFIGRSNFSEEVSFKSVSVNNITLRECKLGQFNVSYKSSRIHVLNFQSVEITWISLPAKLRLKKLLFDSRCRVDSVSSLSDIEYARFFGEFSYVHIESGAILDVAINGLVKKRFRFIKPEYIPNSKVMSLVIYQSSHEIEVIGFDILILKLFNFTLSENQSIRFSEGTVGELSIKKVINYGTIDFVNFKAYSNQIEETKPVKKKVGFSSSDLGKFSMINCNFRDSQFEVLNSKVSELSYTSGSLPKEFVQPLDGIEGIYQLQSLYGQLEVNANKAGLMSDVKHWKAKLNRVLEQGFALERYRPDSGKWKRLDFIRVSYGWISFAIDKWQNRLILLFSRTLGNYGQSAFTSFFWFCAIAFFCFSMMCIAGSTEVSLTGEKLIFNDPKYISYFFNFLNPVHKHNLLELEKYDHAWGYYLFDYLGRAGIGYSLYHLISATRKFSIK